MVRLSAVALAACIAFAACDDSAAPPPDFAAPEDLGAGVDDLALGPDFAPLPFDLTTCTYPPDAFGPPPDAAGFCDGTALAGTCAQAFFARARACFHPAGCCAGGGSNKVSISYESGATFYWNMTDDQRTLTQDRFICAQSPDDTTANAYHWTADDGSDLPFFNPRTGDLRCPGGTQLNVGAYGGCSALHDLLYPVACTAAASCCTPYGVP